MPSPTAGMSPSKKSEIKELIKKGQQGDLEAREKAFFLYLYLADQYAKAYAEKGVPYEDLYQEACYGILVALDRYDTERGVSFQTYADSYIKKYIHDSLITQNSFLPSSYDRVLYYEIKHYMESVESYKQLYSRSPSEQDLAKHMNISLVRIRRLKRAADMFMVPSVDLDCVNNLTNSFNDSGSLSMEDKIVDQIAFQDLRKRLTQRQFEVLKRRLGFTDSGEPERWGYISAAMGYSIDTLRNDFYIAITKIRNIYLASDRDL